MNVKKGLMPYILATSLMSGVAYAQDAKQTPSSGPTTVSNGPQKQDLGDLIDTAIDSAIRELKNQKIPMKRPRFPYRPGPDRWIYQQEQDNQFSLRYNLQWRFQGMNPNAPNANFSLYGADGYVAPKQTRVQRITREGVRAGVELLNFGMRKTDVYKNRKGSFTISLTSPPSWQGPGGMFQFRFKF